MLSCQTKHRVKNETVKAFLDKSGPAFLWESALKGSAVKTQFNSIIYLVMSLTLRYASNHLQTKQGQVWEHDYGEG